MSIIEVRLGDKDRERLGVTGELLLDEEDLLDLTFEQVTTWEKAFGVSLPQLFGAEYYEQSAVAKKALTYIALELSGTAPGAYAKFTILPNRCRLVELPAKAADAIPPANSSSTSSEDTPAVTGSPKRSRGRGAS